MEHFFWYEFRSMCKDIILNLFNYRIWNLDNTGCGCIYLNYYNNEQLMNSIACQFLPCQFFVSCDLTRYHLSWRKSLVFCLFFIYIFMWLLYNTKVQIDCIHNTHSLLLQLFMFLKFWKLDWFNDRLQFILIRLTLYHTHMFCRLKFFEETFIVNIFQLNTSPADSYEL